MAALSQLASGTAITAAVGGITAPKFPLVTDIKDLANLPEEVYYAVGDAPVVIPGVAYLYMAYTGRQQGFIASAGDVAAGIGIGIVGWLLLNASTLRSVMG